MDIPSSQDYIFDINSQELAAQHNIEYETFSQRMKRRKFEKSKNKSNRNEQSAGERTLSLKRRKNENEENSCNNNTKKFKYMQEKNSNEIKVEMKRVKEIKESELSITQMLNLDNTCLMNIDSQAIADANNIEYRRDNIKKLSSPKQKPNVFSKPSPKRNLKISEKEPIDNQIQLELNEPEKLSISQILSTDNSLFLDIDCDKIAASHNINIKHPAESRQVEHLENDDLMNLTLALKDVCQNDEKILTQVTDCMKSFETDSTMQVVKNDVTSAVIVRQKDEVFKKPVVISKRQQKRDNEESFYDLKNEHKKFLIETKGIEDLYDWQKECLTLATVQTNRNLIYALPTSGGKSLVAEVLILREILVMKRNAILLLPFVSIVQEKIQDLIPFAMQYNFLVEEYASGKGVIPPTKRREKNSLYISTIEKCQILVDSLIAAKRINEIGLIVVDELHMIGDKQRGQNLELLLTKIMYLNKKHRSSARIVGMSATIENINDIAKFVDADVYSRDFRPVELQEYLKIESNLFYINSKAQTIDDAFRLESMHIGDYFTLKQQKRDPDHISHFVYDTIMIKSSCLIFCASKNNCESVALLLHDTLPRELRDNHRVERKFLIESIRQDSNGKICDILIKTLPYGIAYHHSGLTYDERRRIEDAFKAGILNVICCTSTLAAGVNLPAGRVIIRSPYIGRDFMPLTTYKQMVGRAGRAGKSSIGDSIMICNKNDFTKIVTLLTSKMNLTKSSYLNDPSHFRSMILNLLGSKLVNTFNGIMEFIRCSLAYVQADVMSNALSNDIKEIIKALLKEEAVSYKLKPHEFQIALFEYNDKDGNLIYIHADDELRISKLGEAAVNAGMTLNEAREIEKDLRKAHESLVLTNLLHLLYIVAPKDIINSINVNFEVLSELFFDLERTNPSIGQSAKVMGISKAQLMKMRFHSVAYSPSLIFIYKRFYVAMMLFELWSECDVFDVAKRYKVDRGIVSKLMSSASTEAYSIFKFCEVFDEFWVFKEILENFSKRLQHCCSLELLPLMELPNVKLGRAKMMYKAGIKSIMDVAALTPEEFSSTIKFINIQQATKVIKAAKYMLQNEFDDNNERLNEMRDLLKK